MASRSASGGRADAIADGMYAWLLPGVRPFPDWLARLPAPLPRLALRHGWLRGLLLFVASTRHETIAVVRTEPGWRTLLALRALLGRRRKLVALHFIVHPLREHGAGALIDRIWWPIDRWAVRRAVRVGQVLAPFERELYATRLGLDRERLVHVPWAWRRHRAAEPAPRRDDGPVICSGRAFVDWETLFEAAADADWPLVVVCSHADLPRVRALNASARAEIHCELDADDYARLLRDASVVAIPMHEREISQGHIRLMEANDAAIPVVASRTRSLEGYAVDGETALLVTPGDAAALRAAIGRLRSSRADAERLRRNAFARSEGWTGEDYLAAISDLVADKRGQATGLA